MLNQEQIDQKFTNTVRSHDHPSARLRIPVNYRNFTADRGLYCLILPYATVLVPHSIVIQARELQPYRRCIQKEVRFFIISRLSPRTKIVTVNFREIKFNKAIRKPVLFECDTNKSILKGPAKLRSPPSSFTSFFHDIYSIYFRITTRCVN